MTDDIATPAEPTIDQIAAAETVMGLAYTGAERALMAGTLGGQIASAVQRRAFRLDNAAPMALRFDPRPPGFAMPGGASRVAASATPPGPLPEDDTDIAFAPVTRLAGWIAGGALTARRLTDIFLDRIERHDPRLNAVALATPDRARAEADAADALLRGGVHLGPLHGIPCLVKDLFDTAGIETAWGAEPFRGRVPDSDATIVRRLRAAGAVLLGKASLGALAYNDIWYGGRCRNPWNTEEGSSGSSAGSAAAVAAGLCGFAIGTETLGSITSPSQRCGTTGLRPTFGRVSRSGAMALAWSMDKVGPICRSVEDTALVLGALNGADPGDPATIAAPFRFDAGADWRGMRVGWLEAAFGDGATEVDHAALAALRGLGVAVQPVSLPDLPYGSLMNLMFAEAAAAFEDLTLDGRDDLLTWQDADAWPNIFRRARFLSAVDHVQLDRLRWQVMLALDAVFRDIDAMIGPFSTGPMLVASNFTGHPCLHLRAGFIDTPTRAPGAFGAGRLRAPAAGDGPAHTLPQGISLWGRLFDEGRLVRLGMALEAALDVAGRRPPGW